MGEGALHHVVGVVDIVHLVIVQQSDQNGHDVVRLAVKQRNDGVKNGRAVFARGNDAVEQRLEFIDEAVVHDPAQQNKQRVAGIDGQMVTLAGLDADKGITRFRCKRHQTVHGDLQVDHKLLRLVRVVAAGRNVDVLAVDQPLQEECAHGVQRLVVFVFVLRRSHAVDHIVAFLNIHVTVHGIFILHRSGDLRGLLGREQVIQRLGQQAQICYIVGLVPLLIGDHGFLAGGSDLRRVVVVWSLIAHNGVAVLILPCVLQVVLIGVVRWCGRC